MHILVVLVVTLVTVNASHDLELWKSFKTQHGKTYKSYLEENVRYKIFQSNLHQIEEHNKKFKNGESTWEMGVTQFSDLTDDEFIKSFGHLNDQVEVLPTETFSANLEDDTPDHFDWRGKISTLSELRIQYYCGAYWAMNTLDAIESQVFLKHQRKVRLSEQELLDCSRPYGNRGCSSGSNVLAAKYIIDNGIAFQENYPFKRYVEKCSNETIPKSDIKLKGYVQIESHNETALRQALVSVGPISVVFFNYFSKNYKSGIIDISYALNNRWDNGGLLMGYGVENNTEYWIVQSYFGPQWGENGYFRIARNKNDMCGIALQAVYPIIE